VLRLGTALLLLALGSTADAEVEVAVGPNLQVSRGTSADGSIGTGFLARALVSRTPAHAWGLAVEGLWLVPTERGAVSLATQQDVLVINRLRPPVGLKESLGIDVGAGVTRFSGLHESLHPTIQLGASISGRLAGPLRFEIGMRLAITPNLLHPELEGAFAVPRAATWRFGGAVSARL
jgi:hypothetical protein